MMRATWMERGTLVAVMVLGSVAMPAAGQMPLDSLFDAHRLPLTVRDDSVSGPGWDFLLEAASDAQFVMVGESHYVREIPLFTASLFEALHARQGFQYLALEDGPWAVRMLMAPEVRGDPDATFQLAARFRNALQFYNDQDVELIARAGGISDARVDPVWGLDQTWGTLHIFERLVEIAPGPEARAVALSFADRARVVEAYRPEEEKPRFLTDSLTIEGIERLQDAFRAGPPEADSLLDMLQTSFEIYTRRTDGPAIYRSNDRRERFMKARFAHEYDQARSRGDSLPRVLLKLGQWHAIRGVLNWGDVQPLGTFISEFAHRDGMESLHIWTGLVDDPGLYWTLFDSPDYVPLAKAGSTDGWWIVDLRPIRALVAAGQVRDVNEEMRKVIFGFDVALLIGNGVHATYDRLLKEMGR